MTISTGSTDHDGLLTPDEVSGFLQVPVKTLAHWRTQRMGPLAIRLGVHVRYRRSDLDAFLEHQAAEARKGWTSATAAA